MMPNSDRPPVEEKAKELAKLGEDLAKKYPMQVTYLMNAFGDGLHAGMTRVRDELKDAMKKREKAQGRE